MTIETWEDLKQYVGSKDEFTDDLLNMGYTKGKKDGRAEAIEECKQILLSAMAKDGKTKCHEYMVALNEMEQLKEQNK